MIRKIVLVMFLFGIIAHGVSATTYTASMNSQPSSESKCDEFNYEYNYAPSTPGLISPKTIQWSGYPDTGNGYGIEWSGGTFGSQSGTIITNSSISWIWAYGNCPGNPWAAPGGSWITVTDAAINTASGYSCLDGVFDAYLVETYGNTLINTTNNSYSFDIIEGLDYSIYFNTTDEWYNFTASGSDETWNPACVSNNADFNFTNLSYTSPVKQYITSTVTVDINDTDGTISSAIARIDGSNYSMQFIGGEKWRYLFAGTNIIKNYYITNIYATDNEGGQDSESYNASYIHVESRTGGGGGGGGGSYPPDPTIPPSEPCTLNCDTDGDGTCDLNCDDNDDGTCDRNCDTDSDGTCDLNCDDNDDGTCDRNCDTNDDGTCDLNCDDNDDGTCDRNCDTNDDGTCDLNCDDNNDGTCDRNCDTDGDGYCDVNCDDSANRPRDEDIPDDFKDLFEDFRDGDIPDDFWTDKNLRIHPASLNSTAFYTGWDKPQNITYRFLTNKFIDSCKVTNGSCTIDQRFLVNFNTIINENTTGYRGTLTVSRTGETAIADIYINVINLCACKEITPWQLNISDEWAQKLVYFVRVKDGAIVCIRWWAMIALLIILLGIVLYDSNKR